MERATALLTSLSPRGRIILAGSALAFLVFVFFVMKIAGAPSYTTLASGIDPGETSKATAALDEKGIRWELQNNGTAIAVDKAKLSEARVALADKGLPGRSKPGFELFDKQKLGASDFEQKVSYQRALEGEVARTIGEIDGLSGAQVQLTLPDDELFLDEQKPATAAVLLTGGGEPEPATVRGIAKLTASSVEGLKPDDVTITSSSGRMLWPQGDGGGATTKLGLENRYERQLESNLNALVAQSVGPGKGMVRVNAELNADRSTEEQLRYARRGTPVRERTETERLEGGGGGGTAGTQTNVPTFPGAAAGGSGSNYRRQSQDVENGVDKTVTRTKVAPGSIERQSVALLVDSSVPSSDVEELQRAVEGAAGIDGDRGDKVTVSQVKFAKPEAVPAGPAGGILGIAKWVALGVGTLVFVFLLIRHLRRHEDEEVAREPVWLRELTAPMTLAQLENRNGNGHGSRAAAETMVMSAAGPSPERQAVDQASPERIAQQVRMWMKE